MNEAPFITTASPRIALPPNVVDDHIMPPKRKNPCADSIAANPQAARLLTQLFAKEVIKPGEKAAKWYNHPQYAALFSAVAQENFRKRFKTLYDEKFGE